MMRRAERTPCEDAPRPSDARRMSMEQTLFGLMLVLGLLAGLGYFAASRIDEARNRRLLSQYAEDAVVAAIPLADGMRPTPIAIVMRDGDARLVAITIQDARFHRDDLLPRSLSRTEVASFSPPSPMRDAFVRDLVQRVSARLDCRTGELRALRMETARGLSDRPTLRGPVVANNASLPTRLDASRTSVVCGLPTTRG